MPLVLRKSGLDERTCTCSQSFSTYSPSNQTTNQRISNQCPNPKNIKEAKKTCIPLHQRMSDHKKLQSPQGLSFANGLLMLKILSQRLEIHQRSSFDEAAKKRSARSREVVALHWVAWCYNIVSNNIRQDKT